MRSRVAKAAQNLLLGLKDLKFNLVLLSNSLLRSAWFLVSLVLILCHSSRIFLVLTNFMESVTPSSTLSAFRRPASTWSLMPFLFPSYKQIIFVCGVTFWFNFKYMIIKVIFVNYFWKFKDVIRSLDMYKHKLNQYL